MTFWRYVFEKRRQSRKMLREVQQSERMVFWKKKEKRNIPGVVPSFSPRLWLCCRNVGGNLVYPTDVNLIVKKQYKKPAMLEQSVFDWFNRRAINYNFFSTVGTLNNFFFYSRHIEQFFFAFDVYSRWKAVAVQLKIQFLEIFTDIFKKPLIFCILLLAEVAVQIW